MKYNLTYWIAVISKAGRDRWSSLVFHWSVHKYTFGLQRSCLDLCWMSSLSIEAPHNSAPRGASRFRRSSAPVSLSVIYSTRCSPKQKTNGNRRPLLVRLSICRPVLIKVKIWDFISLQRLLSATADDGDALTNSQCAPPPPPPPP